MSVVEIPLTAGYVAVVDEADAPAVLGCGSRWRVVLDDRRAYARRHVRKPGGGYTSQPLHTFLTGWPLVDHIDGDGLNNVRANLRPATPAENAQNRSVRSDSKSGLKGVQQRTPGRWIARIQVDGRRLHLGVYASADVAARAYDAAAPEYFGDLARTNFPPTAGKAS